MPLGCFVIFFSLQSCLQNEFLKKQRTDICYPVPNLYRKNNRSDHSHDSACLFVMPLRCFAIFFSAQSFLQNELLKKQRTDICYPVPNLYRKNIRSDHSQDSVGLFVMPYRCSVIFLTPQLVCRMRYR